MKKNGKSHYSYNGIVYDIFKTENGSVYLNDSGILVNNNIHLEWSDIFEYLNYLKYKIEK